MCFVDFMHKYGMGECVCVFEMEILEIKCSFHGNTKARHGIMGVPRGKSVLRIVFEHLVEEHVLLDILR